MSIHRDDRFAVLMDGMNCFFEIEAADARLSPDENRKVWAQVLADYTETQDERFYPDPLLLWQVRMEARIREPFEREGQEISHEEYMIRSNLRALRLLAETSAFPSRFATRECAEAMFRHHHGEAQLNRYLIWPDIEQLVRWIVDPGGLDARLIMVTTQQRARVERIIANRQAQKTADCFESFMTREEVEGVEKQRPRFWEIVSRKAGISLSRTVVIGSNAVSDGYAAKVGAKGIFILDRDGQWSVLLQRIFEYETTRGVPIVPHNEVLPQSRFLTFVREIDQSVRERLRATKAAILESDPEAARLTV